MGGAHNEEETTEYRIPRNILEWRLAGRRSKGRPRKRQVEDVEEDLTNTGRRRCMRLCNERAERRKYVEKTKTHTGL